MYNYIFLLIILILAVIISKIYKSNKSDNPFPIDVVYTWAGETNSNHKRLSNNNELKYSLRSVIKFAPWVNKIYILMNPPKTIPSWFNNKYKNKIVILDHIDTYPLKTIHPIKNSNSIETTLHNIPNLSEHFIYFNDDVFLGSPTQYTDFFTKDGKPLVTDNILRAQPMLLDNQKDILKIKYPLAIKKFHPHVPISLLKSQIKKFHSEYPEYIKWVQSKRFRVGPGCNICKINNLVCPCAQQHQVVARYMYDNNQAVLTTYPKCDVTRPCNTIYVNSNRLHVLDQILEHNPKFFCINDTTNDPIQKQYIRYKMNKFFKVIYPEVPYFEKKEK